MKSLHWSCRMRKRKFPMIMIRVASPHFLSAPSTRRTPLLWIFARWWKLSWKPPGRSRTTICPIRISTNSSLPYSVPAGFGADALQQEHYRSPTNVRTLTPNSNDQRQGIIMAMVSCLLCYICLFFHGRVWYTRLSSTNRNLWRRVICWY